MKLVGSDAVGLFSLQREVKARDGIDEAALESAARLAFETVQERWKMTRGSPAVATAASRGQDATKRRLLAAAISCSVQVDRRVLGPQGMAGHPLTPAKRSRRAALGPEVGESAQRRDRLRFSRRS